MPAQCELYIAMAPLHCFCTALFLQATFSRVKLSHCKIKAGANHIYLVHSTDENDGPICVVAAPIFLDDYRKYLTATQQLTQIFFFFVVLAKHYRNISLWYSFTASLKGVSLTDFKSLAFQEQEIAL